MLIEDLEFQLESEKNKNSTMTESLNSFDSRITNKKKDISLNTKEIEMLNDRIKDIEQRISIKKKAKEENIKQKKQLELEEEEKQKLKMIEEAKLKQNEKNTNGNLDEENPANIKRNNLKKNDNCGCCLIF